MLTIALPYLTAGFATLIALLYFSGIGATYSQKRYFRILPTIANYPDSEKESVLVQQHMNNTSDEEIMLFHETNEDGVEVAFMRVFPDCGKILNSFLRSFLIGALTIWLKIIYNRPRPVQVNNKITPYQSISALTPSYPSGHALEAYYAARLISNRCPEKKQDAYNLADKCAHARVIAGLHYPSDGLLSKKIVESIPNWLLI